jgi:hypothetical protein
LFSKCITVLQDNEAGTFCHPDDQATGYYFVDDERGVITHMLKLQSRPPLHSSVQFRPERKHPGLLLFIGMSVPLVLVLLAGTVFLLPRMNTHAREVNPNCTLIVPPNPLSAQGLATPYQLTATNANDGPCNEANAEQAAFVQGAILNPATGAISIYHPLVVDRGTQAAIVPTPPQLPANAIVALWFGFNGDTLTLRGRNGSLAQGRCINGVGASRFGQFAYCNAPAFFAAANRAIQAGRLQLPPLGVASDGRPCPTVRDFSVVDMDQSDNLPTTYLITAEGKIAQMTAANMAALPGAQPQKNPSDNLLLDVAIDGALGCTPWKAPDLADNGNLVPALPLNELQAARQQAAPVALIPAGNPMVLVNDRPSLLKMNLYRSGVNQPPVANLNSANTTTYCRNMVNPGLARIQLNAQTFRAHPSPDPAAANSLFTFLAVRFNDSYGEDGLNCAGLLKQPSPIKLTNNANGVAIDAKITLPNSNGKRGNRRAIDQR